MMGLVRAVSTMRQRGQATRRRRMPRQRYPLTIEVEYAKLLLGVVVSTRRALAPLLGELPNLLERGATTRAHHLIEQVQQQRRALDPSVVAALARRVADHQRVQFARQVQASLGVDVDHLGVLPPVRTPRVDTITSRVDAIDPLRGFVAENVSLIRSLGSKPVDEIEQVIMRAFGSGQRHETLAKEIEERFQVAESRARVIARDQIGKLNGQVNAAGQKAMGIESFIWRTANDESVRPEHEALEGQEFRYDDPPDEGLPGEPIQCRCYAEPVFRDIFAELDALEAAG